MRHRFLARKILWILISFEKTIIYMTLFIILLIIALVFSGIELNLQNIALILSLNYEPKNELEAIALLFTFFLELSPIMAFVEVRTLSLEERAEKLASKLRDHIILVGCGHLGRRIVDRLIKMGLQFCLIVLPKDKEDNELVLKLLREGVPIVFGHAAMEDTLLKANIRKAKAIIIAINNDSMNMIIAEKAKKLNPSIKTVVRIFNESLAKLAQQSGYADEVLSTTAISVDTYIVGAFLDVIQEMRTPIAIRVSDKVWFRGMSIRDIEEKAGIKILAINREGDWIRVTDETIIKSGDSVIIYAKPGNIKKLIGNN